MQILLSNANITKEIESVSVQSRTEEKIKEMVPPGNVIDNKAVRMPYS